MTTPVISPSETFRTLTRIEAKQDLILERYGALKDGQAELKTTIKEQCDRIDRVETRQNRVAGGLTVAVFMITLFGSKIREIFFG